MSAETLTAPRGLDLPNRMYEPFIDPKFTKAEIIALLNMIRSSFNVPNKKLFKALADTHATIRNASGNIDKKASVEISKNTRISLEELSQNIGGEEPIQIIQMTYFKNGDRCILTLSRHTDTNVTLQDSSEADFDKPYHQPRNGLTSNDKEQLLRTLLNGLDPAQKPISPSQPRLFH